MNLKIPRKEHCKYLYNRLKQFYKDNKEAEEYPDLKELKKALNRFSDIYDVDMPWVVFYEYLGIEQNGNWTQGEFTPPNIIKMLTPYKWEDSWSRDEWISTFFHELGHYLRNDGEESSVKIFVNEIMKDVK